MRAGFAIIGIGTVVIAFGILFFLQGNSVVGPASSFMYANPQWVTNGQWIAVVGIIILGAGITVSLRRPKS